MTVYPCDRVPCIPMIEYQFIPVIGCQKLHRCVDTMLVYPSDREFEIVSLCGLSFVSEDMPVF